MKPVISNKGLKSNSTYIKGILFGIISASVTIIILLLISAFALTQAGNIPAKQLNIIMLCIDGVGIFFGSYLSLRVIKAKGLMWGCINGLIIFFVIFIAGLMSSTDTIGINTLLKLIISVVCGGLGGIIGVNKRNKVKIK